MYILYYTMQFKWAAIAHHLSILNKMDRITVLDKGKIVELGKMEDLLKSEGRFQRLWKIQNKS